MQEDSFIIILTGAAEAKFVHGDRMKQKQLPKRVPFTVNAPVQLASIYPEACYFLLIGKKSVSKLIKEQSTMRDGYLLRKLFGM